MPFDREASHHTINYVEFKAVDLAPVKEFYECAFGWSFADYGTEYTAFTDGETDGGFAKVDPGNGTKQDTGPLVILYSTDLESSLETVVDCGGEVSEPIFDFPGGRRFHFRDPAGNELAIWSDQ